MQLYMQQATFSLCELSCENFSHASSHSENLASARKVMQLQQVVEMPFCF